jgi:hypothetical protein
MDSKQILYLLILLIICIVYKQYKLYLFFNHQIIEWIENDYVSHIIYTRYKEPDMSLLLSPLVNKKNLHIFIYNKGDDIPSGIPEEAKNIKIINIPNLGWDAYAYLHHVINNYNNLPDYIYSLHASAQYLSYKYVKYINILHSPIINSSNADDIIYYYGDGVYPTDMNFQLDTWGASFFLNDSNNTNNKYVKSKIRPLGNWIKSKLGNIPPNILINNSEIKGNNHGMFKVHKSRILRYSISFYKELLEDIRSDNEDRVYNAIEYINKLIYSKCVCISLLLIV